MKCSRAERCDYVHYLLFELSFFVSLPLLPISDLHVASNFTILTIWTHALIHFLSLFLFFSSLLYTDTYFSPSQRLAPLSRPCLSFSPSQQLSISSSPSSSPSPPLGTNPMNSNNNNTTSDSNSKGNDCLKDDVDMDMKSEASPVHEPEQGHVEALHSMDDADDEMRSPDILSATPIATPTVTPLGALTVPSRTTLIHQHQSIVASISSSVPIPIPMGPNDDDPQPTPTHSNPSLLQDIEPLTTSNESILKRNEVVLEGNSKDGKYTNVDYTIDATATREGGGGVVPGGKKGVYRRSSNPRKKSDDPSLSLFRAEDHSQQDSSSGSPSKLCLLLLHLLI